MDPKVCIFTGNSRCDKELEPAVRYDHISPEVLEGIRNAFQLFDKNGDGRITAEELESVIDTLLVPQTATRDDVERMIHQADTDGNGTVEFEEFFRIMHNFLLDNDPDAEVKKAFELFDLDQNGYIDRDELKTTMQRLGEPLDDEDIDAMMRSADLNADGKIDICEFKLILSQRSRQLSTSSGVSHGSYSSGTIESFSPSGRVSPQPIIWAASPSLSPCHQTAVSSTGNAQQRPALSNGASIDSDAAHLKRRRSSKQLTKSASVTESKHLTKSHSTVDTTRQTDLLTVTVNPEKQRDRPRRPSWTALRNLLKK